MSDTLDAVAEDVALHTAHDQLDALLAADVSLATQDGLLANWRSLEALRRKLEAYEHEIVLDVERRGLAITAGHRHSAGFLAEVLNLDPVEAAGRVRAAEACGHRRSLLGEVLQPAYPLVAAAQAAGVLSAAQQRIITTTVEKLPDAARGHGPQIEADLVRYAPSVAPRVLAQLAARISYLYDQDGALHDLEQRRRNRSFSLQRRPDGSGTVRAEVTAELGELLEVVFDALAAPQPESNGVQDPRSATQRRHDAVSEALKRLLRAGELPNTGGITATIVLTMTADQFDTQTGFATTAHGAQVPVSEARQWCGGDAKVLGAVLDSMHGVLAYSTAHRLFTENQRLVMTARDGGCAFPHCTAPPGWTQAHHITPWQTSKRTSLDNGCLLCAYHHREFERLGWRVVMAAGRPAWIPPRWVDPEQKLITR